MMLKKTFQMTVLTMVALTLFSSVKAMACGDSKKAKESAAEMVGSFQTELKALRFMISDSSSNAGQIEAASTRLVEKGNPILTRIAALEKDCKSTLEKVVADSTKMQALKFEEIETQYHQGKALPKAENDLCYEVKEFVVHPATVTVLARKKASKDGSLSKETRDAMDAELAELAYHLENVMAMTDGLKSSVAMAR